MSEYMVERHRWQNWPVAVVVCRDQKGEQRERRRYVPERTCKLECTIYWDVACANYWEHELSCGHTVETFDKEPPSYCPDCGSKVVNE